MPINENFRNELKVIGKHLGHSVWKSIEESEGLGIHGTKVAVDFDICNGCMKCLKKCTVNVFTEIKTPDDPVSKLKADPIRENDCFDCLICELICPVQAIHVLKEDSGSNTMDSLLNY